MDSIDEDYPAEALGDPKYTDHAFYAQTFAGLLKESALSGMKIVLDCANGATYKTGDTKEIPFGSVIEINGSRILTGF